MRGWCTLRVHTHSRRVSAAPSSILPQRKTIALAVFKWLAGYNIAFNKQRRCPGCEFNPLLLTSDGTSAARLYKYYARFIRGLYQVRMCVSPVRPGAGELTQTPPTPVPRLQPSSEVRGPDTKGRDERDLLGVGLPADMPAAIRNNAERKAELVTVKAANDKLAKAKKNEKEVRERTASHCAATPSHPRVQTSTFLTFSRTRAQRRL